MIIHLPATGHQGDACAAVCQSRDGENTLRLLQAPLSRKHLGEASRCRALWYRAAKARSVRRLVLYRIEQYCRSFARADAQTGMRSAWVLTTGSASTRFLATKQLAVGQKRSLCPTHIRPIPDAIAGCKGAHSVAMRRFAALARHRTHSLAPTTARALRQDRKPQRRAGARREKSAG